MLFRSSIFNAPPYFDGSNYAFWKVRMRAFLCSIDEDVWDAVEIGWKKKKKKQIEEYNQIPLA